ncbi:MAG: oligosaccharide flippase family protein [Clostridiales bacterium]|jgi:stage V sporulation protein B|nr:oligosaccharide flippase family protein [Clostridiales bacterium]
MQKSKFFIETLILSLVIFLIKTIDFLFRSYISKKLGSEGMGFYQIILTFYSILLVMTNMGISSTLTKIISEKTALNKHGEAKNISEIALKILSFSSIFILILVNLNLNFITLKIFKDERIFNGIKFLSPCIVFVTISSCIKGYFYAIEKIVNPAISEFLEQFVKIVSISYLIKLNINRDLSKLCGSVFFGYAIGEFFAFIYLIIFYFLQNSKTMASKQDNKLETIKLLKSSFPLGISSFFSSILHMQEDIMIVSCLKKYGMSNSEAMSQFGIIDGMITPLLSFSLTIFSPLVMTLTPEISKLSAIKNHKRTNDIITKVYTITLILSIGISGMFFSFSDELTKIIFGKDNIGYLLKILSLICPIMCLNLISSAILNALEQQLNLLKYNILESTLRILIIFYLIPIYGIKGFILMVIISEFFMCTLTINKISKYKSFSFKIKSLTKPFAFCVASTLIVYIYKFFFAPKLALVLETVIGIMVMFSFYFTQFFTA